MYSATQFLIGLTGGSRALSSHELLKFNKKSIEAILFLASAFRDIMEHGTGETVYGPYGAIARPSKNITVEIAKEMEEMFAKMIPNDQIQGRVFSRMLWAVPEDIYKSGHCFKLMNAGEQNDNDSSDDEKPPGQQYSLLDDDESEGHQEEIGGEQFVEQDDRLTSSQVNPGNARNSVIEPSGAAASPPPVG